MLPPSLLVLLGATVAAPLTGGVARAAEPSSPLAPPRAAASGTVVDPAAPRGVAALGRTAAWLRPLEEPDEDGLVHRRALVVLDPGATAARLVPVALPRDAVNLQLGTDRAGRTLAYVAAPRGAYAIALGPTASIRRIPRSTAWSLATSFRGQVAWVRRSGRRDRVLTAGSFAARRPREAFRLPDHVQLSGLALGPRGTVLVRGDTAFAIGVAHYLWRGRAGRPATRLLTQSTDTESENGMGVPVLSADGTRVRVSRWNRGGGHPADLSTFTVGGGRRLERRPTGIDGRAETLGLDDGRRVIAAGDVRLAD